MPTPVKLTIKFKADTLEEFVERYGVYVSQGGIFVRTKKPLSVGSLVDFEFKLQNGGALLKGMGTVVWTREHDPARRGAPAGMGLRYDSLDDESNTILGKLLALKNVNKEKNVASGTEESAVTGGTSPGGLQEKTRVASMEVLNALREQVQNEAMEEEMASAPKTPSQPSPIDMDAPVDLDQSLQNATSESEVKPHLSDDEATPLPQAAAPLLPMSEIRDPFEVQKKESQETTSEVPQSTTLESVQEQTTTSQEEPVHQPLSETAEEVSAVLKELKAMSAAGKPVETQLTLFDNDKKKKEEVVAAPVEVEVATQLEKQTKKEQDADQELFEQIDKALDTKKSEESPQRASQQVEVPILVSSQEEDANESKNTTWVWVFVLLLVVLGGALYYWKFMMPQGQKRSSTPVAVNTDRGLSDMQPVAPEPMTAPEPMMAPEPMTAPEPMESEMQVTDTTPPTNVSNDQPIAVPEMAPEKQCAEGEFALKITSVPSGATLTINMEKQSDKTPATFCMKANRGYTISFEHPDYVPTSEFISRLTQNTEVHKQLKPYPWRILIQSNPKGAQVFIDNEKIGATTISKIYEVPQEIWKVELRMPGCKTETFEIRGDDPKWTIRGRVKTYDVYKKLVCQRVIDDDGVVSGGSGTPTPEPTPEGN